MKHSTSYASIVALCAALCGAASGQVITTNGISTTGDGLGREVVTGLNPMLVLEDVAYQAGVESVGFGRGAAMVDFDRDGRLDLLSLNGGGPDFVYRQLADHSFQEVTMAWGFDYAGAATAQSWAAVAADFDGDGDPDVFIGTGGFYEQESNRLLRNDLATLGRFTDVTGASGAAQNASKAFGAAALDYDNDGLLDLFYTEAFDESGSSLHLLRNLGGLVFQEVTQSAGISIGGQFRGCSAGDFDNNGWMDIAVGHQGGPNVLLRNLGDGTFDDVAGPLGVATPGPNFGMNLEDFNNDGWLDIYIPQRPAAGSAGKLFMNTGAGFVDISTSVGFENVQEMGHNTGDIDSDGYPDIFIGSGSMTIPDDDILWGIVPGGEGVVARNLTATSGMDSTFAARTHGSVFGDYDDDGDVDLYVNNGGPSGEQTQEANKLFRNAGGPQRWIKVHLKGIVSNSDGIGARASLYTVAGKRIERHKTAGRGFGNTDSPVLFFGLGKDLSDIDRIELLWPSGIQQTVIAPAVSQTLPVFETGIAPLKASPGQTDQAGPAVRLCGKPGALARVTSFELDGGGRPHRLGFPNPDDLLVRLPDSGVIHLPLERFLAGRVGGPAFLQAWVQEGPGPLDGTFTNVISVAVTD